MIPIKERDQFKEATRAKLLLEVAEVMPAVPVMRASAAQPRISCTIGERLWEQRWGRGFDFH